MFREEGEIGSKTWEGEIGSESREKGDLPPIPPPPGIIGKIEKKERMEYLPVFLQIF